MEAKEAVSSLGQQIDRAAFAGWSVEEVEIGRAKLRRVVVGDREGAINFIEALTTILERTRRRRAGGHHHLPVELAGAGPTRLLSVEIANSLKSIEQRKLSGAFKCATRLSLRVLLAVCGDIPVSKIEPSHITQFWDALRWWPHRVYLRKDLIGLTDAEILEVGRKENTCGLSDSTLNCRLRIVRSFFDGLVAMRVLARSPCDGMKKGIKIISNGPKRRPFNREELETLFDPKIFIPWASVYPHRWWAPMIGLYTGARVGEVTQLKVNDIECIQGRWYMHVRKTVDEDRAGNVAYKTLQVVKSASSVRTIPIHTALIEAGLLEFIEDIKKIKHPRLFPHLHARVDTETGRPEGTGYAPPFTEQFGNHLRSLSFSRLVSFHSFRHLFSTQLKRAGVGVETIGALTGHVRARRVPNLEDFYIHDEVADADLVGAIARLKPPVLLPRYKPGQFAKQLSRNANLYP